MNMTRYALLSDCQRYRYVLVREWDSKLPELHWIMLNPSTADHVNDDPTIRKCTGFATRWGFGSIRVLNLFAFRATKPDELKVNQHIIGAANDFHIRDAVLRIKNNPDGKLVCAWGSNGNWKHRDEEVTNMLKRGGIKSYCLGITDTCQPRHPLYVNYTTELQTFALPYR